MGSAFQCRRILVLATGVCVLWMGVVERAVSQASGLWSAPVAATTPMPGLAPWNPSPPAPWNAMGGSAYPAYAGADAHAGAYGGGVLSPQYFAPPQPLRPRGPLARLVRNRDTSSGLPPFALTDQNGVVQRYVEPVPGVDLNSHVGSVVVVRHDTGRTLLASQLELPALPVDVHSGDDESVGRAARHSGTRRRSRADDEVQRAQFVDDDDSTVELLTEDSDSAEPDLADDSQATIEAIPERSRGRHDGLEFDGEQWSEELPPGDGPLLHGSFGDPMYGDARVIGAPESCGAGECCPHCQGPMVGEPGWGGPVLGGGPFLGRGDFLGLRRGSAGVGRLEFFGEVQFNFIRLHLMEDAVGKLSEKYELAPRFVLGFEGGEITDGRIRYWTYGRDTPRLRGGRIRFEFDVLDIEATQRFQIRRSDIVVGAGFRTASIQAEDTHEDEIGVDLIGMTVAAEAHTHICRIQQGRLAWVFGGRLSLLGGDWGGDEANDFIEVRMRDDNVVTDELFGGIEYSCCYRRVNWHARLAFEMQNWHSDVFAQQAGTDSIGFLGPGIHVGARF